MCNERFEIMIKLYIPKYEDLWFRQMFMADEETMSYNHAWGGTIPFPEQDWEEWYNDWVLQTDEKRFYRYVIDENSNDFLGEVAYHYDEMRKITVADVIIHAKFRGKGYGTKALQLLCEAAKENGVEVLYDDIAIDNPAIALFLKNGFFKEYRTEDYIMLKKVLR